MNIKVAAHTVTHLPNYIYDDLLPQMKLNLNFVIPILMYFLTINIENALNFTKRGRHERRITTTLMTLGFRRYIPSQKTDVIQSNAALLFSSAL